MSSQKSILITGGRLVTMADSAVSGEPHGKAGDLLIRNGKIADILPPVAKSMVPR